MTRRKGSWTLLQIEKRKILFPSEFLDHWKARVKDFSLLGTQKIVREVLVQHMYYVYAQGTFFCYLARRTTTVQTKL